MAEHSKISWTDSTWNPITGCSVVSPGCTNCYAMKLAGGRLKHHPSRKGLTMPSKAGPVWTGEVRLNEAWLEQPFHWRRPRRIFVCAHSDLFHEKVALDWITGIFAVMEATPRHEYQVLTKRPENMVKALPHIKFRTRKIGYDWFGKFYQDPLRWPPPNVTLGISAEDQKRWDERWPYLRRLAELDGWRTFVSLEPLLGRVDMGLTDVWPDQVIVGGESGSRARRFDIEWARFAKAQCRGTKTAFHMKQLGSNPTLHGFTGYPIKHPKGEDPSEWPEDLRVREMPGEAA